MPRGCFFSSRLTTGGQPDVSADDVAEQIPFFALISSIAKLGDRGEVGGAGGHLMPAAGRRAQALMLAACFITFSRVRSSRRP